MKKTLATMLFLLAAAAGLAAQPAVPFTTLSAAVTTAQNTITVASTTNFQVGYTVVVDFESMFVSSVNTTSGVVNVTRNFGGTRRVAHVSGAVAWVGPASYFYNNTPVPGSSCTPSAEKAAPAIAPVQQTISLCSGSPGQWVVGNLPSPYPKYRVAAPEPGATAYTAINTNGTVLGATTLYCTEAFLPTSKLLTGIAVLNGTTVGTDNHLVILYAASGGTAIANSTTAGSLSASASAYQTFAFTGGQVYVPGPADYFACLQSNGSTDNVRMAVTGVNDNLLTKGQTSSTFGTIPTLVAPTAFTTAVGPYFILY